MTGKKLHSFYFWHGRTHRVFPITHFRRFALDVILLCLKSTLNEIIAVSRPQSHCLDIDFDEENFVVVRMEKWIKHPHAVHYLALYDARGVNEAVESQFSSSNSRQNILEVLHNFYSSKYNKSGKVLDRYDGATYSGSGQTYFGPL